MSSVHQPCYHTESQSDDTRPTTTTNLAIVKILQGSKKEYHSLKVTVMIAVELEPPSSTVDALAIESGRQGDRVPPLRRSHTSDSIGTLVVTLPGAWLFGSVPGLVCPASTYIERMRYQSGSATSFSMWHHVKMSEQIRS